MCTKRELASEHLAVNTAALHLLELPECPGFQAYPCGDHWHVGHTVRDGRQLCDDRHAGWHRGHPPLSRDTLQQ